MFTVALIGPDGAGKSTIVRSVVQQLPLPARYVYMGVNLEASDFMLPTTRLLRKYARTREERPGMAGPPDPGRSNSKPTGTKKRALASLRSALRTLNLMGEEWFRQAIVWSYLRRGYVVLFDRHFFSDYYAHDIAANGAGRPFMRRVHGLMLRRLYPRPDLFLFLDAPPEVLLARKGEGTLELLERRREEYVALQNEVEHFAAIDATQTPDKVTRDVSEAIYSFYQTYHSSKNKVQPVAGRRQSVS